MLMLNVEINLNSFLKFNSRCDFAAAKRDERDGRRTNAEKDTILTKRRQSIIQPLEIQRLFRRSATT
jgi:hypothetical protein